jgi:hypothetical protein
MRRAAPGRSRGGAPRMEAGDLYDWLEINEIPALRVMIPAEDEKSEARGTHSRAAAITSQDSSFGRCPKPLATSR